jgi:hypothetical protein
LKIWYLAFGLSIILSACTTTQTDPKSKTAGPAPSDAQRLVRMWIKREVRDSDKFIDLRISQPRIGTKWTGLFGQGAVPNWYVCVNFKRKHWLYGQPKSGPFIVWIRNNKVENATHAADAPLGTKHQCYSAKT